MASVSKAISQTGAISGGSGNTAVLSLEQLTTDFIPTVQVSALGAGTALAVSFQHSPDGTHWKTVGSLQTVSGGSSLSAAGILTLSVPPTTPLYGQVRFSWTLTGGTTTATATFSVYYDKRR